MAGTWQECRAEGEGAANGVGASKAVSGLSHVSKCPQSASHLPLLFSSPASPSPRLPPSAPPSSRTCTGDKTYIIPQPLHLLRRPLRRPILARPLLPRQDARARLPPQHPRRLRLALGAGTAPPTIGRPARRPAPALLLRTAPPLHRRMQPRAGRRPDPRARMARPRSPTPAPASIDMQMLTLRRGSPCRRPCSCACSCACRTDLPRRSHRRRSAAREPPIPDARRAGRAPRRRRLPRARGG